MSDIISYCYQDAADNQRYMVLRSLDGTIEAGSRFQYMEPKIPMGYSHLVDALNRAIDAEEKNNGAAAVSDTRRAPQEVKELDFDDLMSQFNNIIANIPGSSDLQQTTEEGKKFATYWQPRISEIIAKYLGNGKKISQCTRSQVESISLIIDELNELIGA